MSELAKWQTPRPPEPEPPITLDAFLLERIAEEEAIANATSPYDTEHGIHDFLDRDYDWEADRIREERWGDQPHSRTCGWRLGEGLSAECECDYPAYVLAQCASQRLLIEHAHDANGLEYSVDLERGVGTRDEATDPYVGDLMLRALALPYQDHPDYRKEWQL